MKTRDEMYWARWILLPCALWALVIVIPCSLALIKQHFLQSSDYLFWHNADFWMACLTGVSCGLAWIAISGAIAPTRKLTAGLLSCIPGALLAWVLMGETHYRVDSDMAFQGFRTYAPLQLCGWAGLVALFALWRVGRRVRCSQNQSRRLPRVLRFTALVFAGLVFCTLVVPSAVVMWRFTLYHSAMHAITEEGDEKALHALRRLARAPFFDLDWTPGQVLRMIPFGHQIDMEMFGCPSCRGIHTPLFHTAAARGHISLLREMLLRRGSPDYYGDNGQGALSAAIRSHDTNIVALLLSHGVDAGMTNAFIGGTLHQAVMTRAPAGVMLQLIEAGAPVNALTRAGMTPLDCANIWEPDAIPFLMAHGGTNAAVRVSLIPVPGDASLFRFEGTEFVVRLPPGFSPVNRIQTPQDCSAWEIRTADRSSLLFGIGKVIKGGGIETNFNGFAALLSHDEYDWGDGKWSAHGSIAFDSSRHTHAAFQQMEREPRYDAVVEYHALQRRDLRLIRQALQSIGKMTEQAQQTGACNGIPAAHDP